MHPPLGLHLHPDCTEAIEALHACHADNPVFKFAGVCNDARSDMDRCLQREFEWKAQERRIQAQERLARRKDESRRLRQANNGELPGEKIVRGESAVLRAPPQEKR